MKKSLIVISAGAFGREVRYIALGIEQVAGLNCPWQFAGFLDDRAGILDKKHASVAPILGSPSDYVPRDNELFICAIGNPSVRRFYASQMRIKGGEFATLADPYARIGPEASIGGGSLVAPFCAVSCDVTIGQDTVILAHATIGHDVRMGNACHIGAFVFLGGEVTLGDEVTIHPHATILPGVTLHDGCIVGAGAVVTSNVARGTTVFGVPARRVGF